MTVLRRLDVVPNTTCWSFQREHGVDCMRTRCPQWIDAPGQTNCVLAMAGDGERSCRELMRYFHMSFASIHRISQEVVYKMRKACEAGGLNIELTATGRRKQTRETRLKISAALKGRKHSEATKQKIREIALRQHAPNA